MSFFRFLSRRRRPGAKTTSVPDRQRARKGFVICKVTLLDSTDMTVDIHVRISIINPLFKLYRIPLSVI